MQVQSLSWEDPLVEGMTTHSSILSWRIPMDGGAWWATVHGVSKSWTQLSNFTFTFLQAGYHMFWFSWHNPQYVCSLALIIIVLFHSENV